MNVFRVLKVRSLGLAMLLFTISGCVSIPKPGTPIFKDKSGLTWLAASDNLAMNGCANSRSEYDKSACSAPIEKSSPAHRICVKLNARLPSESDIEGLIRSFDHQSSGPKLTAKGLEQLEAAFGADVWEQEIWTSVLGARDNEIALAWSPKYRVMMYDYRYTKRVVRCVR